MSTSSLPLRPSQADTNTSPTFQRPMSDEVFHLAPFLTLNHYTISPVYDSPIHLPDQRHQIPRDRSARPTSSQKPDDPEVWDYISQPLKGSEDDSGVDDDPPDRHEEHHHIIPCPCNAREAYLLLESARADHGILLARKKLAHQIIHRNTLVLQYNRMVLERAQDDLRAADSFIGQVRFLIRRSGQSAFEYASMREDYMPTSSGQPSNPSLFDVDLT